MDVPQLLYDWYLHQWHKNERLAQTARESLSYSASNIVAAPFSKSEFLRYLAAPPTDNPAIKQAFINGFTAGHKSEIAKLPRSVQHFLRDFVNSSPTFLLDAIRLRDAS